ncbi:MAG: hypothetical protein M3301_00690 [Chloroflexota bacterium]|nr:hypothetical protein [Chloroflexota bacterium]
MAQQLERRPATRAELNRALVVNAATKPVNVLVPAAVAVVALLVDLWWLIPLVAVPAFIALVVVTYLDGDEAEKVGDRLRVGRGGDPATTGPPRIDPETLAPPIAAQLHAALAEEARIRKAIARSELPLTEVGREVEGLVRAMEATAGRAQTLWEYLGTQDTERIRRRMEELRARGGEQGRPIVMALGEQLEALETLTAQLERFYAQMEHIVASLSTMHAQLLRMSVASEIEDERALAGQARELREEVNLLAQGMSEVYEQAEEAEADPAPPAGSGRARSSGGGKAPPPPSGP